MSEDKLNSLKKELSQLKSDFNRRVDALEGKIRIYESGQEAPFVIPAPVDDISETGSATPVQKTAVPKDHPAAAIGLSSDPVPDGINDNSDLKEEYPEKKKQILGSITKIVIENILPAFSPVIVLFTRMLSVFRHYQSQGKAPVFLMTIAGILTLIMGFGYLLQYSFSRYLGPLSKVGIGFSFAAAVTFCGAWVNKKRSDMADYASGLIGLGVILAYLCTFFTGPYFRILPDTGIFLLLVMLTAVAYFLAVIFETRVVAVISLLGGVFAPLLMAGATESHMVYLSYILILNTAMLILSRRIDWPVLGYTSIFTGLLVIESIISFRSLPVTETAGMVLLLHLFFYIFYFYNGLEVLRQSAITRIMIILFSSNLMFFLFVLNQVVTERLTLGSVYLANAAVGAGIFISIPVVAKKVNISQDCKKLLQMVCLMSCGLLTGFGILAVTDPVLLGMVWGIEALVLLSFGIRFNMVQIRFESYVILFISFVISAYYTFIWIEDALISPPNIFALEFGYGWVNLLAALGLAVAFIFIMEHSKSVLLKFEVLWLYGWNEGLSALLSLAFLMTAGIFKSDFVWLLSIVPMFYLVFRSKKKNLPLTEYLGLAHMFLLVVPMLISSITVGSFYFSEQILTGKIARIELFLCLYAIAEFYRRFHEKSHLNPSIQILRQMFFCIIPVCFLPGVWHSFTDFFPLAVWFSVVICLLFFKYLKYRALLVELKLLVVGSSLISIGGCALAEFSGWKGYAFTALGVGLVFFTILLFGLKGLKQTPKGTETFLSFRDQVSFVFPATFYYSGVFLFILVYGTAGSAPLALSFMTGWFFILFLKLPVLVPLKENGTTLYAIVGSSTAVLILSHVIFTSGGFRLSPDIITGLYRYGILSIVVLSLYGIQVHFNLTHFKDIRKKLGRPVVRFWMFHVLTCLTYVGTLSTWFRTEFGPALSVALVVHATVVLFMTLTKRFHKLVSLAVVLFTSAAVKIIFFDMNDFSLIQKMTAFIVIGILLLSGAFQYQRMKAKYEGAD